jgi:hypothetical protein
MGVDSTLWDPSAPRCGSGCRTCTRKCPITSGITLGVELDSRPARAKLSTMFWSSRNRIVRNDRFVEQHHHGAGSFQVLGAQNFAVQIEADDDFAQASAQYRRDGWPAPGWPSPRKRRLSRSRSPAARRGFSTQAHDDVEQRAVVHVHSARPEDVIHVDAQRVAVVDAAVDHGGQNVVRGRYGMEVAVECRLIMAPGSTCERPLPVAPPFKPNTGPNEGSRNVAIARRPLRSRAWARPIETTVFPSPCVVVEMAVTKISWPW